MVCGLPSLPQEVWVNVFGCYAALGGPLSKLGIIFSRNQEWGRVALQGALWLPLREKFLAQRDIVCRELRDPVTGGMRDFLSRIRLPYELHFPPQPFSFRGAKQRIEFELRRIWSHVFLQGSQSPWYWNQLLSLPRGCELFEQALMKTAAGSVSRAGKLKQASIARLLSRRFGIPEALFFLMFQEKNWKKPFLLKKLFPRISVGNIRFGPDALANRMLIFGGFPMWELLRMEFYEQTMVPERAAPQGYRKFGVFLELLAHPDLPREARISSELFLYILSLYPEAVRGVLQEKDRMKILVLDLFSRGSFEVFQEIFFLGLPFDRSVVEGFLAFLVKLSQSLLSLSSPAQLKKEEIEKLIFFFTHLPKEQREIVRRRLEAPIVKYSLGARYIFQCLLKAGAVSPSQSLG